MSETIIELKAVERLLDKRYEKHRRIGYFLESENRKLVASGVAQPAP